MHIYPYVYRLDNPLTGEFYIGYRSANVEPSNIDFPKYRTSAPEVEKRFDEFQWYIIAEFFDSDSAYDFEQLLIHENWDNPLMLNGCCHFGKRRFKFKNHTKESKAKLSKLYKGKPGRLHTSESKAKISKSHIGVTHTEESKLKMSKSHTGKILSEEHKLNLGNARRGQIHSEESKAKIREARLGKKRGPYKKKTQLQ